MRQNGEGVLLKLCMEIAMISFHVVMYPLPDDCTRKVTNEFNNRYVIT